MNEARLSSMLEAYINDSMHSQGSELSNQRQENHRYYSLEKFGDEQPGRSGHISADVLDQVESAKSYYREAFLGSRRPIKFTSQKAGDNAYRQATEYAVQLFFEDNSGHDFLRDSLHDALVAKRCVAYISMERNVTFQTQDFMGPQEQLQLILARPEVEGTVGKIRPQPNGLISTKIKIRNEAKIPRLTLIKPEFFARDQNATYVRDATHASFYEQYTRAELCHMGFDYDEVMELKADYKMRRDEEDSARKAHDSTWSRQRRTKRNKDTQEVPLYTSFVWMDPKFIENGGDEVEVDLDRVKLYKVYWSCGKVLTNPDNGELIECIEDGEMPFEEWTQYKISHAENGMCDADLIKTVQWDKSHLRRMIIDNAAMVNTSRWKARHSFVKNPRELLDNNIGSIIWLKTMDSLEPLPTPALGAEPYNLQETLDQEKENRTGLSRLAKGMSGDAVSHQNADSMIMRLTNASNRRVLAGVGDYANTFLRPIFVRLYNMGVEHDERPFLVSLGGQVQEIQPAQLGFRTRMKVSPALTPDEGREQGTFLLQMHATMSADQSLGVLYSDDKKYNLICEVFDNFGFSDATQFISSPQDPQVVQAKQFAKQMADMSTQMQQLQAQLADREVKTRELEAQINKFEATTKAADIASDNLREDDKLSLDKQRFEHEKEVDKAELQIERTQARSATIGD
jgi:hypothetical protein